MGSMPDSALGAKAPLSPNSHRATAPQGDRTPLLPIKADEVDPMVLGHGTENASVQSAVYNLSTTIIGAGIMGLPSKMKVLGLPGGLLGLVAMGFLSEYSIQLMLRCSVAAKVWSYADLMSEAYGKAGRGFTRFFVIVNNIGILVIYMMIIGDVLSGTGSGAHHHPGLLEEWGGGPTWWNSRATVLTSTAIFVLAPLVSLEHVDSLHWSSAISILLAVVFVVITVAVTSLKLLAGSVDFSALRLVPSLATWQDVVQLFTVVPTMATAYVCHYNVHPIYVELAPPREERMRSVARISLLLCTSVYTVTALFGYMLFGEATQGDVLANFDVDLGVAGSQLINDIIRLSYAVHLMLVFPVIHFSLRGNVDSVLFPHSAPLVDDRRRFTLVTIGLMLVIFLGAALVPNIDFAFHFTGSVAAVSLAFTCPGLAALSPTAGLSTSMERTCAWIMVFLGIGCTVTGLGSNIYALFRE